jgi:hypothetical protein
VRASSIQSRPNIWLIGGLLAPLVYVAAVVVGGILTPGYSHVAGPVGALTMPGAPAALVLIPLFALYNALLIAFAFTVRDVLRAEGVRLGLGAPTALAVAALLGALMLLYPIDPVGAPSTETGRMHLWFAAVASFATMLAVLSIAGAFGRSGRRAFAIYSYVSLAAILVSDIWAVMTAADMSALMGLAERLTIGAFLQWLFVLALALLHRPRPTSA